MTDFKPFYESDRIKIFEYPQPIGAIVDIPKESVYKRIQLGIFGGIENGN